MFKSIWTATLVCFALSPSITRAASARPFWDSRSPDRNADRLVRLFKNVCIDHLGRSARMNHAVNRSGAGFGSLSSWDDNWGPVWTSPLGRIEASDHSHHHDGDECQINLRRSVAPSTNATIAALRRHRLISGRGEPGEFGSTVFRTGDRRVVVRYDVPEAATGVGESDAGLTLLIQRPPG